LSSGIVDAVDNLFDSRYSIGNECFLSALDKYGFGHIHGHGCRKFESYNLLRSLLKETAFITAIALNGAIVGIVIIMIGGWGSGIIL